MSIAKFVLVALILLAPSSNLYAQTWSVSRTEAWPGDTVPVEVKFRGDGRVVGTDVRWKLETARLQIDAPTGEIEDAARAGRCAWDGAGTLGAIYFGGWLGNPPAN